MKFLNMFSVGALHAAMIDNERDNKLCFSFMKFCDNPYSKGCQSHNFLELSIFAPLEEILEKYQSNLQKLAFMYSWQKYYCYHKNAK